jgi:hypothetical protein
LNFKFENIFINGQEKTTIKTGLSGHSKARHFYKDHPKGQGGRQS